MVQIRFYITASLRTVPIKKIIYKLLKIKEGSIEWSKYLQTSNESLNLRKRLIIETENLISLNADLFYLLNKNYTRGEIENERADICKKLNELLRKYRKIRSDFNLLINHQNGDKK